MKIIEKHRDMIAPSIILFNFIITLTTGFSITLLLLKLLTIIALFMLIRGAILDPKSFGIKKILFILFMILLAIWAFIP